ncbi:MAG: AAA family ATPase [Victivallaceae bacterium]|nr:AAA family ATPase [Victivallaceae bacterium]
MTIASHRLKELRIVGGFLDGFAYTFSDKLNCIIGARGTGKTTVLEFIRYGLNAMPPSQKAQKRIASLVESNLNGGRIEITIETADGITYIISRNAGEQPMVLNADRSATGMTFTPNLFPLDIFSQNEVEEIAGQSAYQMALLESFSRGELREMDAQISQTQKSLEANAANLVPLREKEVQLTEALNLLPGLQKQLNDFAADSTPDAKILNVAHEQKSIRNMELQFTNSIGEIYQKIAGRVRGLKNAVADELQWCGTDEMGNGVNYELMRQIYAEVAANNDILNDALASFVASLNSSYHRFGEMKKQMTMLHQQQELQYRTLVEKGKEEQARSAERRKVADEHTRLLASQSELGEVRRKITALMSERNTMLHDLSVLRDRRFQVRDGIAQRINDTLAPHIRVTLTQFGGVEPYFDLLVNALKGTAMLYRQVAGTITQRIEPPKLAEMIRDNDQKRIMEESGVNQNQAKILVTELNNIPFLSALEIVELPDTTKIELRDHQEYKPTETLSTGQKCNAILPILLLDSDRPLLIDQPEDNLDNEFVHDTIVDSVSRVKMKRQMVFVTHNPNIPVLAEAEKILVMESDGCAGHIRRSGTVDDCKENIVNILEGGEEAFKKRKMRYAY